MAPKSVPKEMMPLQPRKGYSSQGDEEIVEEQAVKFLSRPRRKVLLVVAVIVIVIIIVGVLLGTLVPNYLRGDDENNECK